MNIQLIQTYSGPSESLLISMYVNTVITDSQTPIVLNFIY